MSGPSKHPPALEVLRAFLRLGCLSFGGPVAHLGYFHAELVERRRWCSSEEFAEVVALAQSLPGPASSQVAFALGLLRAQMPGALAAWVGFTMPSAVLMFAFACGHAFFAGTTGLSILHGLQLAAVAIVAQAVLAMQRSLAPDIPRLALALAAGVVVFLVPAAFATTLTIFLAAAVGLLFPKAIRRSTPAGSAPVLATRLPTLTRPEAMAAAALFLVFLVALPVTAALTSSHTLAVFNGFYRTGAMVFGGGHVVLPLLENTVVARGWVDEPTFLAGYGAAQAVPGPLFTFAAFLGASLKDPATGIVPASLAARAAYSALTLVAIFLPGLLLMLAVLPFWASLRRYPLVQSALSAINAAVVGILFAALVRPVATTALHGLADFAIAAGALIALTRLKTPPWLAIAGAILVSVLLGRLTHLG